MGTGVRNAPARVAAVAVGVLWGRRHREARPEALPVTEVGVVVAERGGSAMEVVTSELFSGSELMQAPDRLTALELPLVTFNAPRFDWPALSSLADVDHLISRTIDLHSALLPCVADLVEAEGTHAFPARGEYGVLHPHRVAETNLGFVPGDGTPLGEAELALELWHHLLTHERAIVAGRTHALAGDQLALLSGERSTFTDARAWRAMLAERPEPAPYRRKTRHPVAFPRIDQRYV